MGIVSTNSTDRDTLRYLWTPDLDPLFRREGRSGAISAWYGHVPFAHWIIGAANPHTLVELGTHNGVSYSAFCEAVIYNRLGTRCYAVDTWKGDDHAGYYGDEVYLDFRRFHDDRYGAFSELLRCTFDEARAYIADASVDLLHIDGLHTYEAVRHDFENWRPKLTDRAVVLLHSTNVRESDFGVWRLWDELRMQFPSFEFLHGHGLGVLAVGHSLSPEVAALCSLHDSACVSAIRQRFCLLGERWILQTQRERGQIEEVAPREERILSLADDAAKAMARAATAEALSTQLEEQLHSQSSQAAAKVRQLEEQLHSQSSQAADKVRQLEEQLHSQSSQAAAKIRQLEEQVEHVKLTLLEARRLCHSMSSSLSWRLTWPLRVIREAGAATLNKVQRRDNSPLKRAPESSK